MAKPTDGEMRAELLRLHNLDRWGGGVPIRPGPMRRALVKVGWMESRKVRFTRPRWFLTDAGRAQLIDVPGSGIYHSKTFTGPRP